MEKVLATTSIEETWGLNNSILFLGQWCLRYKFKDNWLKRSYRIQKYHWSNQDKFIKSY